jgi:hypothetical protein
LLQKGFSVTIGQQGMRLHEVVEEVGGNGLLRLGLEEVTETLVALRDFLL